MCDGSFLKWLRLRFREVRHFKAPATAAGKSTSCILISSKVLRCGKLGKLEGRNPSTCRKNKEPSPGVIIWTILIIRTPHYISAAGLPPLPLICGQHGIIYRMEGLAFIGLCVDVEMSPFFGTIFSKVKAPIEELGPDLALGMVLYIFLERLLNVFAYIIVTRHMTHTHMFHEKTLSELP